MFTNVTKGLEEVDEYFADLLHDGRHVRILEVLLGEKPEPTTASFFTKTKHSEEVNPHSDAMEGGVIWIALDETNEDNGCLHFLRGSHEQRAEFAHLKPHEPNDLSRSPRLGGGRHESRRHRPLPTDDGALVGPEPRQAPIGGDSIASTSAIRRSGEGGKGKTRASEPVN